MPTEDRWSTGVSVEESLDTVVPALGEWPLAVAVFATKPESTSACVITWGAAVQVMELPTASVVEGQVTAPAIGSVTSTLSSVTLPVFSTRNDQLIVSPRPIRKSPSLSVTVANLVSAGLGRWLTTVVTLDGLDGTGSPFGAVPSAVAVLVIWPASMSVCVMVYGPDVHVVEAPGAKVVTGQDAGPAVGSATVMPDTVVVPVLVTLNDQTMVSVTSIRLSALTSVTSADL